MDMRRDGQRSLATPCFGDRGHQATLPAAVLGKGRAPCPAQDTSQGLGSCIPTASRRSFAQGLPLLPPLCSFLICCGPCCFLPPACPLPAPLGCIAASPGVPRWGAPKYGHVDNNRAGAKLQAQPRGRGLEEQVAQSIPRDEGPQHPNATGPMISAWAARDV